MDIAGGKSGSVGWWMMMVAAAGIWMVLPLVESAATCPDQNNVTIPCPMNEVENLTCTYVKGIPAELPSLAPGSNDIPREASGLSVEPYLKYDSASTQCNTYLNITWTIDLYTCQFIRGFILNVTFPYEGKQIYIYRTYNLSVGDGTDRNLLPKTAIRHECIVPAGSTLYEITVQSLPMTKWNVNNSVSIKYPQTTAPATTMSSCDSPDKPDATFNWVATMWVSQNSSDITRNTSLDVCFFLAPVVFGFRQYRLSLLYNNTSDGKTINQTFINDNGARENRKACVKFDEVCPGTYRVELMPVPDFVNGQCTCRLASEQGDCGICMNTVLQSIDMTNSVCVPTTTTATTTTATTTTATTTTTAAVLPPKTEPPPTTETASTSSAGDQSAADFSSGKIGGIVAGVILAIILLAAIVLVLHCRRSRKSEKLPVLGPGSSMDEEMQVSTLPERHRVLLVYSTDNESHRKVIRSFASFLHACCGCEVLYDEWSQVDIAQTNPIDWLSKQMYGVKQVVVVNSLGAYEQNRGWLEQKLYVPDTNLLLPDVFIPAIRQVQSKVFSGGQQFRCFHVCFPYTDPKHVLDLSGGKCYRLMDHIEDLFLHIHGLTKFSARGTTSADQINAANYYLTAKEGIALRRAIEEAVEFARENPNWFQAYYRRDNDSTTGENSASLPALPRSGSSPVNSAGSDSSSIGTASDMEYFAPSLRDSCSGEDIAGEGAASSSSPDAGIGGMGQAVSASSSSSSSKFLLFAPLPPDGLDDDASSIGSRSVVAKINELNDQYDSGLSSSMQQDLADIHLYRT